MSTSLIEAKIGQGLLVVCSPHSPDVSLQMTRALFLRVLFGSLPSVIGLQEAKKRTLVEVDGGNGCPASHRSITVPGLTATQMSFGLWLLLSLIFSSSTVWSFLFLLRLPILGE